MTDQNIPKPKKNIHLAMAAYPIFIVPLLSKEKDDPFVKFHTHQGIGLFVIVLALQVVLPFFIMLFSFLLMPIMFIIQISIIALVVIGMKNAYHGIMKPLPYIGEHIESFFKK
jgi:uncharacterized membrane protein